MASAAAIGWREKIHEFSRETGPSILIVSLVLLAGVVVGVIALSAGLKASAVVAGAALAIILAFATGNPRLCCLWALGATLSLSLGKRFGPMFLGKVGGEDSFRIELNDVFLFALFGFIVWELITDQRKGLRVPKVSLLWLLLVGIGCIWIVIGPWHLTASHEVFRMLKVLLLFIVITNELSTPRRIWHCVAALSLGAIGQSIVALIQYHMKGLIGLQILGETSSSTIDVLEKTSVQGEQVFRPSGLLEHANLLGIFLVAGIALSVAMLLVTRRPLPRLFFLIAIAVALPAEIVARSRSDWVSAAISLVILMVLMFLHRRLRSRAVVTACLAVVIGSVLLGVFSGTIVDRLLHSKDDATKAREIYKADARRMIAAAPWVGHGLNSYTFELPNYATLEMKKYGDAPPSVHNIFYLWWAETGFFGLLIFCAVWASIIWTGFANISVRDDLLFVVNAASVATVISLIPDGFLSFTLRVNTTLRLFWLLAGLIMAVRYLRLQERATLVPRRRRRTPAEPELTEPVLATQ